jgi:hypothetical protein
MRYVLRTILLPVALAGFAAAPTDAASYYVSPSGTDANVGSSAAPWRTLQKAAATMVAGDTALIADGEYAGGIYQSRAGTASAPITFRAMNPGGPVVRGDQTTARDAFFIEEADHVIVDGLTIRQANRAAIRVSLSNHVTIRRCRTLNNTRWGIFTDYSDDLLIEQNECAGSGLEHGIYVSNSGDRPVIRGNVCYDNYACGIQINSDPGLLWPEQGTRGDGITEHALIEGNVVYNNGTAGGAAINLASVRSSRIVNNLLYHNKAGGISGWDDGYGTQWGSKENVILHNTIYFRPGEGRWCVSLKNGSTGNVLQNNLLHGGARGALEFDSDSSILSDYNLLRRAGSAQVATNEDTGVSWTLAQWQAASGNDTHSRDADPLFVSLTAPVDFHLQAGSPGLDAGVSRPDVTADLEGSTRPQNGGWDLGCYERTGTTTPPPPAPELTAPTNLAAVGGRRQITLTWTQSTGASVVQNRIYRATASGGPYTRVATISAATQFVDKKRTRGVTYYYRVTAVDSGGMESPMSNEASARAR